jgi:hypothetical protein
VADDEREGLGELDDVGVVRAEGADALDEELFVVLVLGCGGWRERGDRASERAAA